MSILSMIDVILCHQMDFMIAHVGCIYIFLDLKLCHHTWASLALGLVCSNPFLFIKELLDFITIIDIVFLGLDLWNAFLWA